MATRVGMVSLGCSKNQVDAEIMLAELKKEGFEICADAGLCDVVIINTCGFIEDAKRESIENILEFCTLKQEGRIKLVVVTGCLAERYREEVAREIPEADVILGLGSNAQIVSVIRQALLEKKPEEQILRFGNKEDLPLSGDRLLTNLPFFAYLKIAEGCSNCCSYCAIPMIRGRFRSRTMEDIVSEAQYLADHGVTELVLIAQDTTRYGEDLYGKSALPQLLERLAKIENLVWIRVLYCYPERITDELLDVMAREEKVVNYLDIPIQHASGRILKKMNRRGDRESLTALIEKIRAKMPDVILRTTLITGFPGETEEDFEKLCSFVKKMRFDRLGCFAYSAEEGTPAAEMPDQIDEELRLHRSEVVMDEQYDIMQEKNAALLGSVLKIVVEGYDRHAGSYFGRSRMDAPDIDTKTFFTSDRPLRIGEYVDVAVEDVLDYDLLGSVVQPEKQ